MRLYSKVVTFQVHQSVKVLSDVKKKNRSLVNLEELAVELVEKQALSHFIQKM